MKALHLAAGCTLVLGLAGCGGSDQDTTTAVVMPDVVGRQLDVALSDIKSAGFTDKVDVSGGGTFGVVNESNWQVCAQSPTAGASITAAPQLTVDRSCGDTATTSTTSQAPPVTSSPATQAVLTAATSADLAALLSEKDDCSETIGSFASTYRGRTIEFDGNIAALANHENYTTRYDILVHSGDFSPSTATGPNFQFRDVGITDLGLTGSNNPDSLAPGDNLHVVAQVEDYNSTQCLLILDPVSTQLR